MTRLCLLLMWLLCACGRFGFSVAKAPDASRDGSNSANDGAMVGETSPYNLVFVTSSKMQPGLLGGIAGADAECNRVAMLAGLKGNYLAWISGTGVNAKDRFGSARGWVRMDGKAVADTMTELSTSGIWYPVVFDELGMPHREEPDEMITGTDKSGVAAGGTCSNWTDVNANNTYGNAAGVAQRWTAWLGYTCTRLGRLYCFGTDKSLALAKPMVAGPVAFVSFGWNPNTGLAGADANCNQNAQGVGLSGTFKALLATNSASAASRFSATGDVWIQRDGLAIAASRSEFFADRPDRPVFLDASGVAVSASILAGALQPDVAGIALRTCNNWSDNGVNATATYGETYLADSRSFGSNYSTGCSSFDLRTMCLQTP